MNPLRKPRTRNRGAQPVPTVSDDESDLNPSDIPPPQILRTNDELNLSVLRHHDPAIQSILSIAPYAVVYVFSALTQQWEKNGVEGCLFVCRLATEESSVERYAVMVLNKRGLENFSAELLHGDDVEITNENVNIRVTESGGGEQSIFGIWIFSEPPPSSTANARAINARIIQDCAARAESTRKLAAKNPQAFKLKCPAATDTVEVADNNVRLSIRKPFDTQEVTSITTDQSGDIHMTNEAFSLSADTEFFRNTSRTLRKAWL